jgi:hypothetical protein
LACSVSLILTMPPQPGPANASPRAASVSDAGRATASGRMARSAAGRASARPRRRGPPVAAAESVKAGPASVRMGRSHAAGSAWRRVAPARPAIRSPVAAARPIFRAAPLTVTTPPAARRCAPAASAVRVWRGILLASSMRSARAGSALATASAPHRGNNVERCCPLGMALRDRAARDPLGWSFFCQGSGSGQKRCAGTCRGKFCTPAVGCCRGYTCLRVDATGDDYCGGCSEYGASARAMPVPSLAPARRISAVRRRAKVGRKQSGSASLRRWHHSRTSR